MGDRWHVNKPIVRPYIVEDMKKYVKDFNPDDYYINEFFPTDESVFEFLREYYNTHLPVSANAWLRAYKSFDERLTAGETVQEECGLICRLADMFTTDYKKPVEPMIIGLYTILIDTKRPIYQINIEEYGLEIVLKKCKGNWRLSVKSNIPLDFEYYELFDPTLKVRWYNQDEFPIEKTYKSYEENHCEFTIEIKSNDMLFMYFYLLRYYLDHVKEDM